jgi:hypothetical protein
MTPDTTLLPVDVYNPGKWQWRCKVSDKKWQVIKVRYCQHADAEVGLEAEVVYPAEWLPDQPPRINAHRCSHAFACNLDGRASCVWAGTNPAFDPFREPI